MLKSVLADWMSVCFRSCAGRELAEDFGETIGKALRERFKDDFVARLIRGRSLPVEQRSNPQ